MGYEHLFGPPDLALLYDWLQQTGELYMELDRPHSGGPNSIYVIQSLPDLKRIVAEEKHPEVCIDIFREKQYPIRGIIDEGLLAAALGFMPDGEWFSILSPGDSPYTPCDVVGFGECHDELREDFTRLRGSYILFGRNPFDTSTDYFGRPGDVWSVKDYQDFVHQRRILSKNWTSYAPFETGPERYRPFIAFW